MKDNGSTEELAAAEAAISGSLLQKGAIVARALVQLLRFPDDTKQVFILALVANSGSFARFLRRLSSDENGARLLREQPSIDTKSVDYDALRKLPDGTLGREYVRYLDVNGLDPDLFAAPPGLPPVPAYVAKRLRQVHDVWHVLTGYQPNVPGEIALQGFTFGQTHMPMSFILAAAGSLRWSFTHKGIVRDTLRGYRRGRKAVFLPVLRLEDWWGFSLDDVRREFRILPKEPAKSADQAVRSGANLALHDPNTDAENLGADSHVGDRVRGAHHVGLQHHPQ